MNLIKGTILCMSLLAVAQVNAQDDDAKLKKAQKKLRWMDTDKNGHVTSDEMKAFYEGKKDKKGAAIDGAKYFVGYDANEDGKVTAEEIKAGIKWGRINRKFKKH